ncbi:MAG: cytochrome c [Rhodobacteraceae bacterium]|nr:cytochrome c [Paracoccaceae bacterium]
MKNTLLMSCAAILSLGACSTGPSTQVGQDLYEQHCASCHGADARGGAQIPDLRTIASRAGGIYPQMRVLDKLDGYARGQRAYDGVEMPDFGMLLIGPLDRVETDDGVSRPLPETILALEAYLRSIQE